MQISEIRQGKNSHSHATFFEVQSHLNTLAGNKSMYRFLPDFQIDSRQNHINLDSDDGAMADDDIVSARIYPNKCDVGASSIDVQEMLYTFSVLFQQVKEKGVLLFTFFMNVLLVLDTYFELFISRANSQVEKTVQVLKKESEDFHKKTAELKKTMRESAQQASLVQASIVTREVDTTQEVNVMGSSLSEVVQVTPAVMQSVPRDVQATQPMHPVYREEELKLLSSYYASQAVIKPKNKNTVFSILYCELIKGKKYPCIDRQ
jgi:hypothetical protein